MNKLGAVLILVLCLNLVFAECSNSQIDLNSASENELDKIIYVGPATAEKIIAARPFNSVESLIEVRGIGETKLSAILEQNLACVSEESSKKEKEEIQNTPKESAITQEKEFVGIEQVSVESEQTTSEISSLKLITLNAKTIKGEENTENHRTTYAKYGFAMFCFLLGVLLIIKRKKYEDEFR